MFSILMLYNGVSTVHNGKHNLVKAIIALIKTHNGIGTNYPKLVLVYRGMAVIAHIFGPALRVALRPKSRLYQQLQAMKHVIINM